MKASQFGEEHLIGILREHEARVTTAEVCRKRGIVEATFYKIQAKYGSLDVSDASRLKTILGNAILRDVNSEMYGSPRPCKGCLLYTSDAADE